MESRWKSSVHAVLSSCPITGEHHLMESASGSRSFIGTHWALTGDYTAGWLVDIMQSRPGELLLRFSVTSQGNDTSMSPVCHAIPCHARPLQALKIGPMWRLTFLADIVGHDKAQTLGLNTRLWICTPTVGGHRIIANSAGKHGVE